MGNFLKEEESNEKKMSYVSFEPFKEILFKDIFGVAAASLPVVIY